MSQQSGAKLSGVLSSRRFTPTLLCCCTLAEFVNLSVLWAPRCNVELELSILSSSSYSHILSSLHFLLHLRPSRGPIIACSTACAQPSQVKSSHRRQYFFRPALSASTLATPPATPHIASRVALILVTNPPTLPALRIYSSALL